MNHRVRNKWYKELWWTIQEKFNKKEIGEPTILYGGVYRKDIDGFTYIGGIDNKKATSVGFDLQPVTREAKKQMKQVHKEKGRLDPVNWSWELNYKGKPITDETPKDKVKRKL